jgi:hypothetical protein
VAAVKGSQMPQSTHWPIFPEGTKIAVLGFLIALDVTKSRAAMTTNRWILSKLF